MFESQRQDKVSRFSIPGEKNSAGIGFLAIPSDVNRDQFIASCYQNGTVSFISEDGSRTDNAKVSTTLFNDLIFPTSPSDAGSQIVWVNIPIHNQPMVIAVICKRDESIEQSENTIKEGRRYKANNVSFDGDAKNGIMIIDVESMNDNNGGNIIIKVKNKNSTGKVLIDADGEIELRAGNKITSVAGDSISAVVKNSTEKNAAQTIMQYSNGSGLLYRDEFGTEIHSTEEETEIKHPKNIVLGIGTEGATLGETCKLMFDEFIDEVSKITTTTAIGQMPILNKSQVIALKEKTKDIISKYLYIQ